MTEQDIVALAEIIKSLNSLDRDSHARLLLAAAAFFGVTEEIRQ